MKLTKGTKPDIPKFPDGVKYKIEVTGNYIEIEIDDIVEILKLKARGFTET